MGALVSLKRAITDVRNAPKIDDQASSKEEVANPEVTRFACKLVDMDSIVQAKDFGD